MYKESGNIPYAVAKAGNANPVIATEEGGASRVARILTASNAIKREQELFAHSRRAARAALMLRNR